MVNASICTVSPLSQMPTFTLVLTLKAMTLGIAIFPSQHPPKIMAEILKILKYTEVFCGTLFKKNKNLVNINPVVYRSVNTS